MRRMITLVGCCDTRHKKALVNVYSAAYRIYDIYCS